MKSSGVEGVLASLNRVGVALLALVAVAVVALAQQTVTFHGLVHTALGQAVMTIETEESHGERLILSNIGASGKDGVSIDLEAAGGWFVHGEFDPGATGKLEIEWLFDAATPYAFASLGPDGKGTVQLIADFVAAGTSRQTVEAFFDEDLLGAVVGHANGAPAAFARTAPHGFEIGVGTSNGMMALSNHADAPFIATWDDPLELELANGLVVIANRLAITPESPDFVPSSIVQVDVTAAGIDSFTLDDEGVKRIDHFLGYAARTTPFTPLTVTLVDQFEEGRFDVLQPTELLNPADKNGEGILDPETHLVRYDITPAPGEPPHVPVEKITVNNQFGSLSVDTIEPVALMVPSSKVLQPPLPPPPDNETHRVDHYKCYTVAVTPDTPPFERRQVTVNDQFDQPKDYDVIRPAGLCNPVDKNDEGIKHPEDHLFCYVVRPVPGQPEHVPVAGAFNNQFQPQRFRTIREREFCLPSEKILNQ